MITIQPYTPKDLLEVLRLCAHRLLVVYDKTLDPVFWDASEQAANACEYLLFAMQTIDENQTFH